MSKALRVGAMFAWLAGCGGGGSSGVPPTTAPPDPPPPINVVPPLSAEERFSAGMASTTITNEDAFGQSPEAIQQDFAADANFKGGNAIFRNDHSGQGPLLNAATCQGCHIRDGRGTPPPNPQTPFDSMVLALSLGSSNGAPIPDPNYGLQLQTFGLASFQGNNVEAGLSSFGGGSTDAIGEGFAEIEYEAVTGSYADGSSYELRKPIYRVRELSYGDFGEGIALSPRLAPQLIGLGALDAIPEADIRALADPNDADGDGISGRVSEVFDPTTESDVIGRFGYKASTGSILHQIANAYRRDIGVTSVFAPEELCATGQLTCDAAAALEPNNFDGGVDIPEIELALVEFYNRLLAVPERRGFDEASDTWDATIVQGRTAFFETGCGGCHQQSFTTGTAAGSVLGEIQLNILVSDAPPIEVLSEQDIYPYTDMLLHDMGGSCEVISREDGAGGSCDAGQNCTWVQRCEGLADGREDGSASGTEWRTAPLWGLGLVKTVNPNATFLH
ncbi:MAG: di-heme oxidoredictase family protein, partial [Pseudomonadota bacterium]